MNIMKKLLKSCFSIDTVPNHTILFVPIYFRQNLRFRTFTNFITLQLFENANQYYDYVKFRIKKINAHTKEHSQ